MTDPVKLVTAYAALALVVGAIASLAPGPEQPDFSPGSSSGGLAYELKLHTSIVDDAPDDIGYMRYEPGKPKKVLVSIRLDKGPDVTVTDMKLAPVPAAAPGKTQPFKQVVVSAGAFGSDGAVKDGKLPPTPLTVERELSVGFDVTATATDRNIAGSDLGLTCEFVDSPALSCPSTGGYTYTTAMVADRVLVSWSTSDGSGVSSVPLRTPLAALRRGG